MRAQFEREGSMESPWTSYNASLGRPLLNSEKFLNPKKTAAAEGAAEAADAPEPAEDAIEELEKAPTLPGLARRN
jgi:hypothetical protein